MERIKTPKEINDQALRIIKRLDKMSWNCEIDSERARRRVGIVAHAAWRYIERVYNIHGIPARKLATETERVNEIWHNAATEVSKYVEL